MIRSSSLISVALLAGSLSAQVGPLTGTAPVAPGGGAPTAAQGLPAAPSGGIDLDASGAPKADPDQSGKRAGQVDQDGTGKDLPTADTSASAFALLARRLGYDLPIFGRDFFRQPPSTFAPVEGVPVSADYLLGPGDEIDLRVWGAVQSQRTLVVDRNGQVFIPQVGAITVAGMRYGELEGRLRISMSRIFRNFDLQATMSRLRTVQIYVTGRALRPGSYTISGLSSMVNALLATGGPGREGSLRRIELRRAGRTVGMFDLYALLLRGDKSGDLPIQAGDVIHIPPISDQVALVTGVRTPAIYELAPGESLHDLIGWAGGLDAMTSTGVFRVERLSADSGLTVQMPALTDSGRTFLPRNGDIVSFGAGLARFNNAVTLRGHVLAPGRFPWRPGMRIRDLLPSKEMLIPASYWDFQNRSDSLGKTNLVETDRYLAVNWEYAIIERLDTATLTTRVIPFHLGKAILQGDPSENIAVEPGDNITVFSLHDVNISVEKRPVYVRIEGEVERVGVYRLRHGQTLRDLIREAGGPTPDAYIFGTRLRRPSILRNQSEQYARIVQEMERQFEASTGAMLASASGPETRTSMQQQIEAQRHWFRNLKAFQPEGRLVLEMPPKVGLTEKDLPDVVLEDGDRVVIPPKPADIGVFGEVPVQASFAFRKGDDVADYIHRVGGTTRNADPRAIFVLRADGRVEGYDQGIFTNVRSLDVMPGDAIFIPRKPERVAIAATLKDWTQILANLGIGVAAIVTLTRGW